MAQYVTEYVKDRDGKIRKKEPKKPAEPKPEKKEAKKEENHG